MRRKHAQALRLAEKAERNPSWEEAAELAWENWTEEARDMNLCYTCEAPVNGEAYCDEH